MRGLSLGVVAVCVLGVAHAANFTVVVNGTASHAIPDTLCEYFGPFYAQKRRLINIRIVVGLMFEVSSSRK